MARKKLPIWTRLMLLFNLLAIGALLLAYTASFINPNDFWMVAFFGLGYPFLVVTNLFFVVYWMLRKKWFFFLSFGTILLGWSSLQQVFPINFKSNPKVEAPSFKLMTYNARSFDAYNIKERGPVRDSILGMINTENPDVVCFQEFCYTDTGNFRNVKLMQEKLGLFHFYYSENVKWHYINWGMAVFSRYPIVKSGKLKFENTRRNGSFYVDIEAHKKTVRIYNVHLQSIGFEKEDYQSFEKMRDEKSLDSKSSKKILSKIKTAYRLRAAQSLLIKEHANQSPNPVIICGDFNDTPNSFAYYTLAEGLKDSYVEIGKGLGQTYVGPFPSFRIDYILTDKTFRVANHHTVEKEFSDHYPVVCDILLE